MKIKNMKNGFSLIELAVIVVIIGVMFTAGASVLKGRSAGIEIGKSADRLKQAFDLIQGYAVQNKNLPNINSTTSADNLTDFFAMNDGYGSAFRYIPANNLLHTTGNNICNIAATNLTLQVNENGVITPLAQNVAFVIASNGTDLTSQLVLNGNTITVQRANPADVDDIYKYATLPALISKANCPPPPQATDNQLKILTDRLPIYNKITYKMVSGAPLVSGEFRPTKGGSALITNKATAKWCVESSDTSNANNSIDLRIMDANFNISETEIPLRSLDQCRLNFSSGGIIPNAGNYLPTYGVSVGLNASNITPTPPIRSFTLKVHVTDQDSPNSTNIVIQTFQFVIPSGVTPQLVTP